MPLPAESFTYHRRVDVARFWRLLNDRAPFGPLLAAIVLVASWVATWRPQVDPDAWWHIAFGESIAQRGAIPSVETFSWLTAGDRIVVHSWLWDLLLAEAYRWAGETGTSVLILPATASIVVLLWLLVETADRGMPPLGRALLVLAAMVAGLPAWAPRAQTLDVALVLASMLVLTRYFHDGERRQLLALPIVGVLWANLHGSAILALPACIVLALIALPIGARWGDWRGRAPAPLVLAGIATLMATMINPHGPSLLIYPADREVASAFIPEIVEWRPPDLGSAEVLPFTVLLLTAAFVLIARRRSRPDAFLLIATGAWTVAAMGSARFVAIAACLLVVAIAATLGSKPEHPRPERQTASVAPSSRRVLWATAGLGIAAILAAGWMLIAPSAQDAAIRHRLPAAAVEALTSTDCQGRLLTDYGWGGYVIWAAHRDVGAYGNSAEGAVREQVSVERLLTDPAVWLTGHKVDIALLPAGGPLSSWLDDAVGWRLGYRDVQATIHVRESLPSCLLGSQAVRRS